MTKLNVRLIILTGALILSAPSLSYAQGDVEGRLNRLENELETLNRAVYRGEKPPTLPPINAESAGNLEVRMQQLESQLRDLTGQVEQVTFEQQQINSRLDKLESMPAPQQTPPQPAPATQTPEINPRPDDASVQQPTQDQEQSSSTMRTVRPLPASDAASQYEQAFAYIKSGDYGAAEESFSTFLKVYPDHALTPNAMYWLAESYYVRNQFDKSAKAFAEAYQKYPGGPKGADNLLKLGMSLSGLGKTEEACIALGQLAREYPAGPTTILRRGEQEQDRLNCR